MGRDFIIGAILALLLFLLRPEPFRRGLREIKRLFLRQHPSVTVSPDIDLFDGNVEILTGELLSHAADEFRIKQFYEISLLDWDIIAAHADIERDQQDDVMKLARSPVDGLRFICMHGESGSGKSTLAWRIAAELHTQDRAVVVRIRDKEDPNVWYRMAEFSQRLRRHFYVLADDLFRDRDIIRAVRELSPWLPLTVLATSQSNEYRPAGLKGRVIAVQLGAPSAREKQRLLRRLGRHSNELSSEQLRRLTAASEFLVLMTELSSGKGFFDAIRESLDNLFRLDPAVYRAYEYLTFAYSYGFEMPASLLEGLDAGGQFHDLRNRRTAQGVIFSTRTGFLRVSHVRRAEAARAIYGSRRSSAVVLQELVRAVDVSQYLHRRFIAHLLRGLASSKNPLAREVLPNIREELTHCVQAADRITELTIWKDFYHALGGYPREAERCTDAALALEPITLVDYEVLRHLYRARGRERDMLPIAHQWVDAHPEQGHARRLYLSLVEGHGSREDQARAIEETSRWLAEHTDDVSVREAYLDLFRRTGTPEQIKHTLQETSAWLEAHPDNSNVRAAFLKLMQSKGTAEQAERALQETSGWLTTHPNDSHLREVYLGLVARKGTAERTRDVRRDTAIWLANHPDDAQVRRAHLGLLSKRRVTPTQRERILQETAAWLMVHPDDDQARAAYLGLIQSKGSAEETQRALQETSAWLAEHPDIVHVRMAYLKLTIRKGTPEQTEQVLRETVAWLLTHPSNRRGFSPSQLAQVLSRLFSHGHLLQPKTECERVLQEMGARLLEHPNDTYLRTIYLGLLMDHGPDDHMGRAIQETRASLATNDESHLWEAYLLLVKTKATIQQIGLAAQEARVWLETHPHDRRVRGAAVRLVVGDTPVDSIEEALRETRSWLSNFPDDRRWWKRYVGLVKRKGTTEQAEHVLRDTRDWLIAHPDDSEVRAAYLRLVEARATAEQVEEVLQEMRRWLLAHPDDSEVRAAHLRLVNMKGTVEQAERELQETRVWLAVHPRDERVRTVLSRLTQS